MLSVKCHVDIIILVFPTDIHLLRPCTALFDTMCTVLYTLRARKTRNYTLVKVV